MSASGFPERPHDYAVVWGTGDGATSSGRLELADDQLVLHGAGAPQGLRIPFDELSSIEIGRGAGDRINGEKSLVLERRSCERVLIAALGGVGLLRELSDLLARLRAEHVARARVAVVVPTRRGTADVVRQLIAEGPPFGVEVLGLERHHVFVSEREVLFFFEGESAAAAVDALARSASVLKAAVRWRRVLRRSAAARPGAVQLDAAELSSSRQCVTQSFPASFRPSVPPGTIGRCLGGRRAADTKRTHQKRHARHLATHP